ncbi:hypothetical protein JOM56_015486 [Amanita muscaria]
MSTQISDMIVPVVRQIKLCTQIISTILRRLNNTSAKRHLLSDVVKTNLSKLVLVFFEECLEALDTLNSIIAAIGTIANVVGMTPMIPPAKDLLLRMTPILRNRHEKVQEASINLTGIPAILSEYQTAALNRGGFTSHLRTTVSSWFRSSGRIKVQIETNKPPTASPVLSSELVYETNNVEMVVSPQRYTVRHANDAINDRAGCPHTFVVVLVWNVQMLYEEDWRRYLSKRHLKLAKPPGQ